MTVKFTMLGVRFLDVDFMRINFACGCQTVNLIHLYCTVKSSYPRAACTFTAQKMGFLAYIQSAGTRSERFANYAVITRETPTYSFPSAAGPSHTVRYTEMAPDRFKDFWRD